MSKGEGPLAHLDPEDKIPLPPPFDKIDEEPVFEPLADDIKERYECGLDDTIVLRLPKPQTKEEEQELVDKFISGVTKLFNEGDNWLFLQPLLLTMEH
ncbi:MAG: (Fe-S)-binding protein, partial [Planctomycetota bacterium]